jgi:hypothetical protein
MHPKRTKGLAAWSIVASAYPKARVLTSEFFWGVIVGLVLAAFGAWLQAIFIARQQRKAQKDLTKVDRVQS